MIKTGPLTVVLLAVALLITAPACQKKPPMNPDFHPLSAGEEVRLTLFSTLDMGLRYLDPPTRARYFREVAGQAEDPFLPGTPGVPEPFLVFLFTIDNRGEDAVLISPAFASLSIKAGDIDNIDPLNIHELEAVMATNPAFTPQVSRRFHQATINVNPGQRHAKLLAFPTLGKRTDIAEVIMPSVISGTVAADAHFPFSVTWEPLPSPQ